MTHFADEVAKMEHFLYHESFPDSLRYLDWKEYPLKSLPSQYSPKNLVELHMPYSKLRRLWDEGQNPENLKRIDLHDSLELVEIPSSIWSLNKLVELNLSGCWAIENFPTSSWKLESLTSLKLQGTRIVKMPNSICKMKFLEELDLSHCSNFDCFPKISEPMEHLKVLKLHGTKIKQLPESIGNLVGLKRLDLSECRSLESVPQTIYKLNLLEELLLSLCWKLTKLPSSSIRLCENLEEIPYGLFSLTSLKRLDISFSSIESIPPLVQFSGLTSLDISNCGRLQSLPEVPCLLEKLDAKGCTALKTVSFSMTAIIQGFDQIDRSFQADCVRKEEHMFFDCPALDENARCNIMNDAQLRIMRMAAVVSKRKDINRELFKNPFRPCPVSVICPGNEIPKWCSYQTEGSSINISLPPNWSWSDENFLGFALCAVGTISTYLPLTCRYNFKFNIGQWQRYEVNLSRPGQCTDAHVFVWYHPFIFNDTEWCNEASFEFLAEEEDLMPGGRVERFNVKRCGVGLLYAQGQDSVAVKTKRPRVECEASAKEIVSNPGTSEI